MRRILGYLRPYRLQTAIVVTAILFQALLGLAPSVSIKLIVDKAIPHGDRTQLIEYAAAMVIAPLLAGLLGVVQRYMAAYIAEHVMYDLRNQLFRHVQQQSLGYFMSAKPGEVVSKVLNDVQGVGAMLQDNLVKLVQNALVVSTVIVAIMWLDWRLAVVALCLLPAFVLPTRRVGQRRKSLKRASQGALAEVTGVLLETLSISGALLVKVSGAEEHEQKRLEEKTRALREVSLQHNLVGRWFQMMMKLFEDVGPALIYAVGGWLVISGKVQLGTVVAFVALLKRLYSPASDLASVRVDVVTSYAYFDRIFTVLDLQPDITNPPDAKKLANVAGSIRFDHVKFGYNEADGLVLRDLDLEIPAGHVVAVVGGSGAGKSTLASLVSRLYDPNEGTVLVDGHDIRTLDLHSLRANVGVVTQETYLFHLSILENRTSLVIAHRLSTIRRADLIVVLERGVIIERGTHDELVARGGAYAALLRAQNLYSPPSAA